MLSETIEDRRRARADVIIMTFCPGPNRGRKSYRKKGGEDGCAREIREGEQGGGNWTW